VRGGRIPSGTAATAKDGSGSGYFVSRCKGHLSARRKIAGPAPLRPGAPQGRSPSAARKAMHEAAGGAGDAKRKRQIRTSIGLLTFFRAHIAQAVIALCDVAGCTESKSVNIRLANCPHASRISDHRCWQPAEPSPRLIEDEPFPTIAQSAKRLTPMMAGLAMG